MPLEEHGGTGGDHIVPRAVTEESVWADLLAVTISEVVASSGVTLTPWPGLEESKVERSLKSILG